MTVSEHCRSMFPFVQVNITLYMQWMLLLQVQARSGHSNEGGVSDLLCRWLSPNTCTVGLHLGLRHGRAAWGHHRLPRCCRKLHRLPGWLALKRLLR